jgi:lysozyme family protein
MWYKTSQTVKKDPRYKSPQYQNWQASPKKADDYNDFKIYYHHNLIQEGRLDNKKGLALQPEIYTMIDPKTGKKYKYNTNQGVTQGTYDDYRKLNNLPLQYVGEMSEKELESIYYNMFWRKIDQAKPMVDEKGKPISLPNELTFIVATIGLLDGVADAADQLQKAIKEIIKSQPALGPNQANIYEITVQNALKIAENKKKLGELASRLIEMLENKLRPQFGRFPGYEKRLKSIKDTMTLILNPDKKQVSVTDSDEIDTLKEDINALQTQTAELQQSTQGNMA